VLLLVLGKGALLAAFGVLLGLGGSGRAVANAQRDHSRLARCGLAESRARRRPSDHRYFCVLLARTTRDESGHNDRPAERVGAILNFLRH
jgi:hypothetical protein